MKKFLYIVSIALILAGCSSSAVATPGITTEVKTATEVSTKSVLQELVEKTKLQKNTSKMKTVIQHLKSRVHKTYYVYSGASPRGWDCSGLVVWSYKQFGLELPHSATAQGKLGTRVRTPKVGDIVVFGYKGSYYFDHSSIYIGNGKVINANRFYGTTVIEPLSNFDYYSNIRFIRVVKTL
jgi:cell wall-associated NlpC family hydrolase